MPKEYPNKSQENEPDKIASEVALDEDYESLDKLKTKIMGQIQEALAYYETNFHISWDKLNNLYRGIRARGAYMLDWQNNLATGKPFGITQQVYASIMSGIYPKEKLFAIKPRESTEANDLVAKAWKKTMLVQSGKMHLRRNMGWLVLDGLINDYGILEFGWCFKNKVKKYLDWQTGEVTALDEPERISQPYIESVSPFDFVSDLDAQSWESQEWTARRIRVTMAEIESDPAYNMSEEIAQLKIDNPEAVDTTAFNGWKYCTADTVIVILDSKHIIKKHWTLLKSNSLPYLPFALYAEQRTPGGIGLLGMIKGSLEYIDKIVNSNADNMDLALQGLWTLKSNSDIPFSRLNIALGKIFKVDQNDELRREPLPGPNSDSYKEIGVHNEFIDGIAGNVDRYEAETATQDKLNALKSTIKIRECVQYNQDELVIPMLTEWLGMNQQFLTQKELLSMHTKDVVKEMKLEGKGIDLNIALDVELTGEASEVEKLMEIDNLSQFTNLATAISQLPPDIQAPMYKELANLFGYTDKIQGAGQEQIKTIQAEAEALSQGRGAAVFMGELATKSNMTPEQLMQAVKQAGSIKAFLGGSNVAQG